MSERQRVQQVHGQKDCNPQNVSPANVQHEVGLELGKRVDLQEIQAPGKINPERSLRGGFPPFNIRKFIERFLKPNCGYPEDRRLSCKDVSRELHRVPGEEVNSEMGKPQVVNHEHNRGICDVMKKVSNQDTYLFLKRIINLVSNVKAKYYGNLQVGRVLGEDVNLEMGKSKCDYASLESYKSPRDIISEKVRQPGYTPFTVITYIRKLVGSVEEQKRAKSQVDRIPVEDVFSKKDKPRYKDKNLEDSQAPGDVNPGKCCPPSDNNRGDIRYEGSLRLIQNTYDRFLKLNFGFPKRTRAPGENVNPEVGPAQHQVVDSEECKPQWGCGAIIPDDCQTGDESKER